MHSPETRRLLIQTTATRLALIQADMHQVQAGLAATLPGRMSALEERLGEWASAARDAARLLLEISKEAPHA